MGTVAMEHPAFYQTTYADQDGLWKKVIGELFEDFLLFFDPHLHAYVDFSTPAEFLQQELFQEVVDEKKGRRIADQIAKVKLKDGKEQWILIHVEIQSENEEQFSERMFQYFYRIYDRHQQKIVAYAIMTSPHDSKAPDEFHYNYFGTSLHYAYTNRKIFTYDNEDLERSDQLFSKLVLAARYLHETKDEQRQRYLFKYKLMREVIRNSAFPRTAVRAALHFIDYLLRLPDELTEQLSNDLYPILGKEQRLMELYNDKEQAPPTIVSAFERERIEGKMEGKLEGIREGKQEGKREGLREVARNMLAEDFPVETITAITGLTEKEILELRDQFQ